MSTISVSNIQDAGGGGSIDVQGEGTATTNLQQGLCKLWVNFNGEASGAAAKAVTFQHPFFSGTAGLGGANTSLPSVGITAYNMASGDFFEVSSVSRTGFSVHFKNSSNASVDRNFTYQAVGFGKGG